MNTNYTAPPLLEILHFEGIPYTCRIVCLEGTGAVRVGPVELQEALEGKQDRIGVQVNDVKYKCFRYVPSDILKGSEDGIREYLKTNI